MSVFTFIVFAGWCIEAYYRNKWIKFYKEDAEFWEKTTPKRM